MSQKRKVYLASFKAKVALEAVKEKKTLQELSAEYGGKATVHSEAESEIKRLGCIIF